MISAEGQDRYGEYYDTNKVVGTVLKMIEGEIFFERRANRMSKDLDKASDKVELYKSNLNRAMNDLVNTEKEMTEKTKLVAGKVKDATQKLSDGVKKVESVANFDKLERYVSLLERAEKSMLALAELDKSGKLEKIARALS
jgi:hypothetical protein